MRINKYVAVATGLGRRKVDQLISTSHITIDGQNAKIGQDVEDHQKVTLDNELLVINKQLTIVMLNKPLGYVVSHNGQGAETIYDLLPEKYAGLKPVGRLDKDSRGLVLLSNDGDLINKLAHPSNNKKKTYAIILDEPLKSTDKLKLENGIKLNDGISRLNVDRSGSTDIIVTMSEGRNRQIRRTFSALNYQVIDLNRLSIGDFSLDDLKIGQHKELSPNSVSLLELTNGQ